MKQVKCQMCGSRDIVKENDFYVCSACGMKYTAEEAKKMMVEIEGAVKIDVSEELTNLYLLARRAKDSVNIDDARKYYDMILVKDPTNWEPAFYSLIYQAIQCKIAGMVDSCKKISQGISSIIALVRDNIADKAQQKAIYDEMATKICWAAEIFAGNAQEHFKTNIDNQRAVFVSAGNIAYNFALQLRQAFPEREFIDSEIMCIKQGVKIHGIRINIFPLDNNEKERAIFLDWAQTVKQYDPNYIIPEIPKLTAAQIEQAQREEQNRIEQERLKKEQAQREEQIRIEQERLKKEQAQREEQYRIEQEQIKINKQKEQKAKTVSRISTLIGVIILIAVVIAAFVFAPKIFGFVLELILGFIENTINGIFGI